MKQIVIKEDGYDKKNFAHLGTKFLIANGYMGVRGTLEEYTKEHMCAVNLAGIYNQASLDKWCESLNAPNPFYTVVENLSLPKDSGKVILHEQSLCITEGMHIRKTTFRTDKGHITIKAERFAAMLYPNVLALRYSVLTDFDGEIEICSGIDGDIWDINGPHFVKSICKKDGEILSITGTTASEVWVKTSEKVTAFGDLKSQAEKETHKKFVRTLVFNAKKEEVFGFEKIATIRSSKDEAIFKIPLSTDEQIFSLAFCELLDAQVEYFASFWDKNLVEIEGDEDAEIAINYSIYSLAIVAPRHARAMSIPARGLSGQVYKGAVFWDSEMFMLDYFLLNDISVAETLLMYRVEGLREAKEKAALEGFDGAFYAWESHENGKEACTDFNVTDVFTSRPIRTFFRDKQVHISAAIAYGFYKYSLMTNDKTLFENGGTEVVIECAKFYLSLLLKRASFKAGSPKKDLFEIHDVVGPDEYHERVNNNAYTNRMAKFTLEFAASLTKDKGLAKKFREFAKNIFMPKEIEGVIEQFDGYFKLEDATLDEVRARVKDEREYWGGTHGVAGNTQIIKQADVIAMLAMFKDEFSFCTLKSNLDYYEKRTEHGSSLSACMYGLLQCHCGMPESAYPMFLKSAAVDLRPPTKLWAGDIYIGGSHPASWGGAYQMLVKGFAGINIFSNDNKLSEQRPQLPKTWKSLKLTITIDGKPHKIIAAQTTSTH